MLLTLTGFWLFCQYSGLTPETVLAEEIRIKLRTGFYFVAIITFPLTNLIRHILLRLNQTMPGDTPATRRYLMTVIVSMVFVETIGLYGFCLYWLGDGKNTLTIFLGLSALGVYLYRPKEEEYQTIVDALTDNSHESRR